MTGDYRKDPEAIAKLDERQYAVTQEAATEPAFDNEFWDKKEAGIYVDIVSGEPLFASPQKFDSGCGWPSFTVPLEPANVVEKTDTSFGTIRTEVRSSHGDSHLGHVFEDGPVEEGGLRYCINSAALRFVPYEDLEAEGYGQYKRSSRARGRRGGQSMSERTEKAILAGGCFWGMQDLIRKRPGCCATRVGYTGGDVPNATYRNHGNHAEAIEITFDPEQTRFRELLEFFFQIHDPPRATARATTWARATARPSSTVDDTQRRVAEDTIADVEASGLWPGKVVTEVSPAGPFWEAEPEHQDYLERYPNGCSHDVGRHFVDGVHAVPSASASTAGHRLAREMAEGELDRFGLRSQSVPRHDRSGRWCPRSRCSSVAGPCTYYTRQPCTVVSKLPRGDLSGQGWIRRRRPRRGAR